jgi:hypothetical protein
MPVLLSFGYAGVFVADWKHLRLDDDDLRDLEVEIMENPGAGRVIPGTGGLRKIRFAPQRWGRGKSGSIRVCYVYFIVRQTAFVLAAYAKNEQQNLTPGDKAYYRRLIKAIEGCFPGKERS